MINPIEIFPLGYPPCGVPHNRPRIGRCCPHGVVHTVHLPIIGREIPFLDHCAVGHRVRQAVSNIPDNGVCTCACEKSVIVIKERLVGPSIPDTVYLQIGTLRRVLQRVQDLLRTGCTCWRPSGENYRLRTMS